jgi:hypothetical protein
MLAGGADSLPPIGGSILATESLSTEVSTCLVVRAGSELFLSSHGAGTKACHTPHKYPINCLSCFKAEYAFFLLLVSFEANTSQGTVTSFCNLVALMVIER